MNTSRVLIGITTRNRAGILPRAIESALAQRPAYRVAVVDDGSTDETASLRGRYPTVEWVRHDEPAGYMESRNELMRGAAVEFYVSLDDDAWFLATDEIEIAVRRMDAKPELGAIAFDILSPDRPMPVSRTGPIPSSIFIGCGHMLRLDALKVTGFYEPGPGTYGSEEKDLCYRLVDRGFTIEKLIGVHVWHQKEWTGRDFYPYHRSGVANDMVMTLRRCPFPDVAAVLPLKLFSYASFWLRHPGYFRAGVAGMCAFMANAGKAWKSRAPVSRTAFWRTSRGLKL